MIDRTAVEGTESQILLDVVEENMMDVPADLAVRVTRGEDALEERPIEPRSATWKRIFIPAGAGSASDVCSVIPISPHEYYIYADTGSAPVTLDNKAAEFGSARVYCVLAQERTAVAHKFGESSAMSPRIAGNEVVWKFYPKPRRLSRQPLRPKILLGS